MCTSLPIVPLCCVCKWTHSANVGNTSVNRIERWGTEEEENTTVTHQKPLTWKTELKLLRRELTSPTTEHHQCTSIRFCLWREKSLQELIYIFLPTIPRASGLTEHSSSQLSLILVIICQHHNQCLSTLPFPSYLYLTSFRKACNKNVNRVWPVSIY